MLFLLAAENDARHAGAMEFNWMPAVTTLVVFLVAFGFLYVKVWPKIIAGLDDRQNKIRDEIAPVISCAAPTVIVSLTPTV